jgi:glycosyltransferase involved in cell wall biosynthesis
VGFCRRLAREPGVDFTLFVPGQSIGQNLVTVEASGDVPIRHMAFHRWRLGSANFITFQPAALAAILGRQFDVVVLANDILGVDVWLGALLGRLVGKPVVLWGHGVSRPDTGLRRRLRKTLMTLARANVLYADPAREDWIARGLAARKLFVAHNARDTDEEEAAAARVTPDRLAAFRRERGLDARRVILFVGRLQTRKQPARLVEAMATIARSAPDALAVFIGDGPESNAVARRIEELGLAGHVRLEGPVHDEATLALYFACTALGVMPASAGLFIQHAFSYGVPIVLGDAKASHGPEAALALEGQTARFFRDGDAEHLAALVLELLADPGQCARLGAAGQRLVREKYNVRGMLDGFLRAVRYAAGRTG